LAAIHAREPRTPGEPDDGKEDGWMHPCNSAVNRPPTVGSPITPRERKEMTMGFTPTTNFTQAPTCTPAPYICVGRSRDSTKVTVDLDNRSVSFLVESVTGNQI
jgi:hypothetical protein